MSTDPLLEVPFADRRGCWLDECGNNWEAILLEGSIDTVGDALAGGKSVGLVKRDVTKAVLAGNCPVPDGRWALLVKLVGTNWVHLADPTILNPFTRDLQLAERLAAESGLRVLQTGYQKTADATYVMVHDQGEGSLKFESTGAGFGGGSDSDDEWDEMADLREEFEEEGYEFDDDFEDEFDVTRLESKQYADDWWKQFESEAHVQQALLRDLGAYVPFLHAYPKDEAIEVAAVHEDCASPENIERIDLVVFGKGASAEPNPASRQLRDAIASGDLAGVEVALAAGATVTSLPGVTSAPVVYAIEQLRADQPDGARVVAALLAAGAAAESPAGAKELPLIEAVKKMKGCPHLAADVVVALVEAGADINRQGEPSFFGGGAPLHEAVQAQSLSAVMLLHAQGADLAAQDIAGQTALDRATRMIGSLREHLDEKTASRTIKPIQAIADYLTQAVEGAAPGDWQAAMDADRTRIESENRRMRAAGERFQRGMEQVKEQLDEVDQLEQSMIGDSVLEQPDAIHLQPLDSAKRWTETAWLEAVTQRLTALGYATIGDFSIDEMPDVCMRAMLNDQQHAFAAVGVWEDAFTWIDLVRFHADGNVLTVTNAPVDPAVRELEESLAHTKVYLDDGGPDELAARLADEEADSDVVAITADEFVKRFEEYYRDDIAAKKSHFQ